MKKLVFGYIIFSDHAIDRYKTRVLQRKGIGYNELSLEKIKGNILKDVAFQNVRKIVSFGADYKFVFTRNNLEFRFERSKSKNKETWVLITVVRYNRVLPWEEPLDIDLSKCKDGEVQKMGIGVAIKIREQQKIKHERGKKDGMVSNSK